MSLITKNAILSNSAFEIAPEHESFLKENSRAIKIIPTYLDKHDCMTLPSGVGSFAKWIKKEHPTLQIEMDSGVKKNDNRSNSFWLPLVCLAFDVTLQFYLGLVINYVYEKLKGDSKTSIKNSEINLETEYLDEKKKITKRFKYSGSVDGLETFMEKYNPNP